MGSGIALQDLRGQTIKKCEIEFQGYRFLSLGNGVRVRHTGGEQAGGKNCWTTCWAPSAYSDECP